MTKKTAKTTKATKAPDTPTVPDDPTFVEDKSVVDVFNELRTTYQNLATTNVKLTNAQLGFIIDVSDVENLGEALDKAAIGLLRWGMDSFYIVVTDQDTGDEYVVADNQVIPSTPENMAAIRKTMQTAQGDDDKGST